MTFVVRQVESTDWPVLREIRLAALQEAPSAFGSNYAREQAWPDEKWQDWAAGRNERGDDSVLFLAFDGDHAVGIVGGYDKGGDSARLIAMWVAPAARGLGIGASLVNAVLVWARGIGRSVVDLHVTEGNTPAIALYRKLGFEPTEELMPLTSDPTHTLRLYKIRLAPTTN